jgi:hypothetical protein
MANLRLNRAGLRAMLKDSSVELDLERRMERVLAVARANAPVDSGAYRNSLHVETVEHPSRVVVRVVADVDYAMVLESRYGILSRALDAAGGR